MTDRDLRPETAEEARDMIVSAAASETIGIIGGGSKSGLGHGRKTSKRLSTTGLSGIVNYNPAEMIMTARAGTTMAEIDAALDGHRQMLAFEPVDFRALYGVAGQPTVGGVFASNMSGPRRLVAGAARDALIGVRLINGFGEMVKSGGRVVKNVTGLDIVKLMAGSFGTLGLMTELTFKVLPRPQSQETIIIAGPDERAAAVIMAEVMALPLEVSGAAYLPESCRGRFLAGHFTDGPVIALRIEGLDFSVAERAEKLARLMAPHGAVRRLPGTETILLWKQIRDAAPFQASLAKPLWRVSVAPTQGPRLIGALRMQTGVDGYLDWQGGLIWLQMEAGPDAEIVRSLIRTVGGGHATLVRASEAEKQQTKVFEPQARAVAELNERIRLKFDPKSIFNPGRMG